EAAKFVGDFKSLANEADASLAKHKALELKNERLSKAVVSQDIMIIVQNESVVDTSNLQTELEPYKNMQQKIERLQAQLGDLKGKSKDTSCVSDTQNSLSQKLKNENMELEFQVLNYARENDHLKATYKNLFDSIATSRLGHNLFYVRKFCDSDLEVAFRRNACFVRNVEGVDLLKGDRSTNLYTINLHEMASESPICLMARTSSTNINGKRYVLVIVDDYSRYTWVLFLRSKDEAPDVIINFLKRITVLLQSPVIIIRTDNGTEFKNQMLKEYFDSVGISHQMSSFKTGLNSMTSRHISSGLDLTYAPLTITMQQPSEGELDLLFEAMYDDYIGGQPSATARTIPPAQEPQVCQTLTASTTIVDTAPTPTNSSSLATNIPISSQDVDELNPNALVDGNTLDHPLEKVIGGLSRPVLTRNQLRSDGDMCMYALTVSTMELKNVKEAMTNLAWIDSITNGHQKQVSSGHERVQPRGRNRFRRILRSGFIDADHPSHVVKLKKALYGLKQAPRAWYDELSKFLLHNHFFKGTIDPTLFIRRFQDDILVVQVYVDDIIFGSTHPRYIQLFSDLMKSCFKMSMMGEMTFFLGLQVNQSLCGIFINQSKYVLEILNKYGMESCDPVGTPMEIKDKLDLDHNGTPVDATKYRSMVGALMYLTSSRPDIVHATCLCARYQPKPIEKHLKEVKRIFRYLRGTVNTGLWYTKDYGFELTGFSDADYTGDTFKSTSGGAQFSSEKLVNWSSKKQDCMVLSTVEAEYVSLSACCAQVLWMRTQLT
nr:uncharacterized mitochondrial protein AtMg00810-like [Tanacetum cinerariifolium]